ncbi:outer membrane protein [Roseovarius sp. M141]|uniref:outer membrane protein n=1 Tax=Roseovarius sp. M141 TaxID=2583806 RepID=UPI0020CDE90C|nr:porin family protein [Roseovarius sp. M141]MCQ0091256.1 porin family protein [Roseovarius sp. M141]
MEPPLIAPAAAAFSWTGPYAGISAGVTRTKEDRPVWGTREETVDHDAITRPLTKIDLYDDFKTNGCAGRETTIYEFNEVSYTATCPGLLNFTPDTGWAGKTVKGAEPIVVKEGYTEVTGSEVYQVGTKVKTEDHATYGAFAGYRHQFNSGLVLGGEVSAHHYDDDFGVTAKAQAGFAFGRALAYGAGGYDFREESALAGVGMDYALTDRWFIGTSYDYLMRDDEHRIGARIGLKL